MTGNNLYADRGPDNKADRCTAIVLLGGKGSRMGTDVPKQYLSVAGRPLFTYSVKAFLESSIITDVLLVIPAGDEEKCRAYLSAEGVAAEGSERLRGFCAGGGERYDSVFNALCAITWPCDYVFIHDGARPLITGGDIAALYEAVRAFGAVVAGSPCRDTVKVVDDEQFVTDDPDRARLWNVQTPQVFSFLLAKRSYEALEAQRERIQKEHIPVTDDAYVAEHFGGARVKLIDTGNANIKVTTPADLKVAEALLKERESARRTGSSAGTG